MSKPTIILLAAGQNSRFFPFNTHFSKAGIQVAGKPIIIRTLENLLEHGFRDIMVVVRQNQGDQAELTELLDAFLPNDPITIAVQPEPLGMGDAVLQVADQHSQQLADKIVVSLPYYHDLGTILAQIEDQGFEQAICAKETNRPADYGILKVEQGKAVDLVEKPKPGTEPSNLKTSVVHVLNREFIEELRQTPPAEYNYETALKNWMGKTSVDVLQIDSELQTLKYPWHLFTLWSHLLAEKTTSIDESAVIDQTAVLDDSAGPIVIEAGAKVSHAARIVGPCFLGKNTLVGDFSLVRGSSLEQGVTVGANSEVVRSLLLPNSSFHFGYLADSIVGYQVKIGAGLTTANKRLDRDEIQVKVKQQLKNTGRTNLGVLIGDQAQIGISVSTMPGTVVAPRTQVMPQSLLKHTIS